MAGVRRIPSARWLIARLKKQAGKCFYCGHPIFIRPRGVAAKLDGKKDADLEVRPHTLDHVYPVSRGGKRGLHNVVLACTLCNTAKGDRLPTQAELDALASINKLPKRQAAARRRNR